MSHRIIIGSQRALDATKAAMTGDVKWVSLAIAVAGAATGGWLF